MLESLLSTLPYPMLMAEKMRSLGLPANTRSAPMMGIVRAADGWIGINCLTGQHWLDVCAMLGLPEYGEHQIAIMLGGPERAEFFEKAQPWLSERTVAEIVELSQAMRIPAAPVNDGATVMRQPAVPRSRVLREGGGDGWSFRRPGAPFRLSRTPVTARPAAPRLGTACGSGAPRRIRPIAAAAFADPAMPFAGREGSRPLHVLGRCVPHLLPRRVRCRDRQGRIDTTTRRAPLLGCMGPRGRRLVRAQADVAGHQSEQARHHLGSHVRAGPRAGAAGSPARQTSSSRTSHRGWSSSSGWTTSHWSS